MNVSFWFEFASTYSYPAAMRIESCAAARGVSVDWRAFALGPIFKAQGWNDSPFNLYPAKGRYMWRDLERICESQRIAWRPPTQMPRSGLLAARVACRYRDAVWLPDFARAVYRANFEHDLDIASPTVIAQCLACANEQADRILDEAQSPSSKALLKAQTEQAVELGIFGAPSFVVDGELFWGHDRLDDALAWATGHAD